MLVRSVYKTKKVDQGLTKFDMKTVSDKDAKAIAEDILKTLK